MGEFLVGFANKGDQDFLVESLEASFRYPMDFTYHIQNFSAIPYQKTVKPDQEATVAYSFIPADAFAGRPIGLTVNLAYRDLEGNVFVDPVFNETVQIVEFDEGFDSEVFFMYVFLVAGAFLVLFLVYSFLPGSKGKKSAPVSKPVETGTTNDDVDYEWIPRSASRRLEATRLAHVRGKATSVMLARIPSNEFQIKSEEEQVEIKFNSDEYYQSNHIISLLPQIVLVLANFYFVSSFLLKVETRTT